MLNPLRCLIFFILANTLSTGELNAQLSFKRTYGPGSAQSIKQTSDGGYIVSGSMHSGNSDAPFLMKTTVTGIPEWRMEYAPMQSPITTVQVSPYGYFISLARAAPTYDSSILIFTDFNGVTFVSLKIPGNIFSSKLFSDGTILATGQYPLSNNTCDLFVAKINCAGSVLWSRTIDINSSFEMGYTIAEGENGTILLGGYSMYMTSPASALMVKLSPSGLPIRQQTLTTSANNTFEGVVYTNGKYIFSGYGSNTFGNTSCNMMVVITDTMFNVSYKNYKWTYQCDEFIEVTSTFDGNYAFLMEPEGAGFTGKRSGILKTKTDMSTQWENLYDDITDSAFGSYPWDFIQTADSGFAIASETYLYAINTPYITITKIDRFGALDCGKTVTSLPYASCNPTLTMGSMIDAPVFGYTNALSTEIPVQVYDSTICFYNPQSVGMDEEDESLFSIYPDPADHELNLLGPQLKPGDEYIILNFQGQLIDKGKLDSELRLDVSNLSPGLYFLRLENGTCVKFIRD